MIHFIVDTLLKYFTMHRIHNFIDSHHSFLFQSSTKMSFHNKVQQQQYKNAFSKRDSTVVCRCVFIRRSTVVQRYCFITRVNCSTKCLFITTFKFSANMSFHNKVQQLQYKDVFSKRVQLSTKMAFYNKVHL